MKKLLLAVFLLTVFVSGWAAITEPGGVVDQNIQARGPISVISGTVTTGGVSQVALASNQFRRYILIQNPSTMTEPLFINFGSAAASATTIEISVGQTLVFESSFMTIEAINVYAASTGHRYTIMVG